MFHDKNEHDCLFAYLVFSLSSSSINKHTTVGAKIIIVGCVSSYFSTFYKVRVTDREDKIEINCNDNLFFCFYLRKHQCSTKKTKKIKKKD